VAALEIKIWQAWRNETEGAEFETLKASRNSETERGYQYPQPTMESQ